MRWLRMIVIFLALMQAGWMVFDGTRAFVLGDYVTPATGPYAGQLGLWSKVVSAVGIEPRSSLMKSVFVIYGVVWLILLNYFVQKVQWAWWVMLAAAIGSLWYLPIGTITSLIQIFFLIAIRRTSPPPTATDY